MAKNYKGVQDVQFLYNPDGSGETLIRRKTADRDNHDTLRVPTEALVDFVAQIVRDRKITKLEQMSPMQVLTEQI